jgi:hypothetical protein
MNGLKNLVIIAVLAAVGYGVYVSLSRNNVESGQSSGLADGWPTAPKVELPSSQASPTRGGPLPLGGDAPKPADTAGLGGSVVTPPPAPPLIAGPTSNAANNAGPLAPPPMPPVPTLTPSAGTTPSPTNPAAVLGPPAPADAAPAPPAPPPPPAKSAPPAETPSSPPGAVRNLLPPPTGLRAPGDPPPASPNASALQSEFNAFMDNIQKTLDAGKLAEAHQALSKFYDHPELPPDMAKRITAMLDQLAGTVIYSRQHHLEAAYMTQPGDTLGRLAERYSVPWQLLARINGLMPPGAGNADVAVEDQPLRTGIMLKVVRGPFNAVIHLDRRELTLMLRDCYAGRFPIGIGRDQPKLEGEYTVRDKTLRPTYYGLDGVTVGSNDPKNPLGSAWIGLTDRIGIHGTSDPQAIGRDDNRGTICASERDVQDLYGILSVGSRVTILR